MSATRSISITVILASAIIAGCTGDTSSVSPSPVPPVPVPAPAPSPPPAADVWNIAVHTTALSGPGGCVADTLRSNMRVPTNYTLSITQHGSSAAVTIRSAAGDFACTFAGAAMTPDGFNTFGTNGYFTCDTGFELAFRCSDGTPHVLFAAGQDISGQISGNQITGRWAVDWDVDEMWGMALNVMSEFTGTR